MNYYAEQLNANALAEVYETGLERVKQYLNAEIDFVKMQLAPEDRVLEMGAGYGRIMRELAPHCASITGVDISESNVSYGRRYLDGCPGTELMVGDVHRFTWPRQYDRILCLQNGLSAMRISPEEVSAWLEHLEVKGKIIISSYSDKFWETRLLWFEEQADKGLLGKLDRERSKNGVIVCEDGFRATTASYEDFLNIAKVCGCAYTIQEVDESILFLLLEKEG